ncbi:MAG TPA: hypothetical protein VFK86_20360, partial [Bauldia sp.]|nr:hypothetical protein [Bauldia sp.]
MAPTSILSLFVFCLLPSSVLAAGPTVADLLAAYPDQFAAIEGNDLVWRDGTRMAISDGVARKDFDTLLDRP